MKVEEANKIIAEFMDCDNYKYMLVIDKVPNKSILSVELMEAMKIKSRNPYVSVHYYSNSLDNLVPVWDKMAFLNINIDVNTFDDNGLEGITFIIKDSKGNSYWNNNNNGLTIQQAACIATAKAIKELEGG